uniref:Uncharacterized protein n=1 Tax=Manihot esculenta TaxID=3983 RepID=A0A2C9UFT8_MANES
MAAAPIPNGKPSLRPGLAPRWIPKRGRVLKSSVKRMFSLLGLCLGKQRSTSVVFPC